MNQSPLVSVVVIFYNAERFFAETLESILAQSYQNWELLLCDDGSTDGSATIAKEFIARFPEKIFYHQHPGGVNLGMSAARNLGLKHARGKYLATIDADDFWMPEKLTEQVALLEANPSCALLYGRTFLWYSWTGEAADAKNDWTVLAKMSQDCVTAGQQLMPLWLDDDMTVPSVSDVMLRTECVRSVGGWVDSFRGMYEDVAIHGKLALRFDVYASSRLWSKYRQHPNNYCNTMARENLWRPNGPNNLNKTFLLWFERYLDDNQLRTPEISRALKQAFVPYRNPALYQVQRVVRKLKKIAPRPELAATP
jgi:glycosyltransferase involved in cell wall biosynthesis